MRKPLTIFCNFSDTHQNTLGLKYRCTHPLLTLWHVLCCWQGMPFAPIYPRRGSRHACISHSGNAAGTKMYWRYMISVHVWCFFSHSMVDSTWHVCDVFFLQIKTKTTNLLPSLTISHTGSFSISLMTTIKSDKSQNNQLMQPSPPIEIERYLLQLILIHFVNSK